MPITCKRFSVWLRFLKGSTRCLVVYSRQDKQPVVDVFSDSDGVGCTRIRRSTSSSYVMLGAHLITSSCTTQNVAAASSVEAEFYGLTTIASRALGAVAGASAWRSCWTKRGEVESAKDAFGARGLASPGPLLDAFSCTFCGFQVVLVWSLCSLVLASAHAGFRIRPASRRFYCTQTNSLRVWTFFLRAPRLVCRTQFPVRGSWLFCLCCFETHNGHRTELLRRVFWMLLCGFYVPTMFVAFQAVCLRLPRDT